MQIKDIIANLKVSVVLVLKKMISFGVKVHMKYVVYLLEKITLVKSLVILVILHVEKDISKTRI